MVSLGHTAPIAGPPPDPHTGVEEQRQRDAHQHPVKPCCPTGVSDHRLQEPPVTDGPWLNGQSVSLVMLAP